MSGFNSRSVEDEAFVDLIRRSKAGGNDFMYIIDTRPMVTINALLEFLSVLFCLNK